ncbi:MAG: glycosyl transferase, partial [Jatrophihabitans endophyticus]
MIGYYVHHHGQGHLARARCVAAAADEPVVALSSLPEPAGHPFAGWVALPPDPFLPGADDPQANGALHWAPLDAPGYARRMAAIADWVTTVRPRVVVVDVSVEVAALVRLLGTRVVVVAGPGERSDDAHVLGGRMATQLVAPWPALGETSTTVVHTGAFSRFDGRPVRPVPGDRRVLVLFGAGGDEVGTARLDAAAAATPGWTWRRLGGSAGWVDDPWDELQAADVVVTHAGLSA